VKLWMAWFDVVWQLRSGFSRTQTFLWAIQVLAGFSIRRDRQGITSFVRSGFLLPSCYNRLRDFFHSDAIRLPELTQIWSQLCLKIFSSCMIHHNGRIVLFADGVKNPKEGRKMPGVKLTHQESSNNSKPEFIRAHSCQCICLLVQAVGSTSSTYPAFLIL